MKKKREIIKSSRVMFYQRTKFNSFSSFVTSCIAVKNANLSGLLLIIYDEHTAYNKSRNELENLKKTRVRIRDINNKFNR